MKKLSGLLLLILLFAGYANAQILPFRTYSIESGLSEAVVQDMMQDSQGYVWVGTSFGLNRFDGIKFKNYYSDDGLSNDKVYSVYEDRQQQIWVGTGSGVNVIRKDSIYTLSKLSALDSSTILSIFEDSDGGFWFATDGDGVWHMNLNGELTEYQEVNGMGSNRVRDIIEDRNGVLWFATRDGLTKFENGNFRTFTSSHGLPDNRLRDLALDKNGTLWIASRGGLCKWEDQAFDCFTESEGLINNRVQSISITESGLWIGTEEGASYLQDGTFTNYSVDEGLSNNFVHTTMLDHEGNIWFGTFGGGMSLFMGNHFKSYTVEEGLPNNVVTSITESPLGVPWIGTYGGGIIKLQDNEYQTYNVREGLVDNKVYTLEKTSENRMLIGTRWGLSIYDNGVFKNFDEDELPHHKIRAILDIDNENEFLLGTYGEGILHFKNGSFTQLTEADGLANNTVLSIEQSADGSIWIATYGGVSRLKDDEFTTYSIEDGLPNNGVLDILESKSGEMWFATFGGLARLNGGEIETITADDGLPDEVCYFLEQDDRGIFWIGTNKGVIRMDYDDYKTNSKGKLSPFKLYTQNQGLAANEMNAGASFKDSRGHLWFGSVGGVTQYLPEKEFLHNAAPYIHIENFRISGDPIPLNPEMEIESHVQNIAIDFIGISFSAPDQVLYEYRLKNSGEDWQQTTQRSVRYSALMPGDYTFEVRAQNNGGQWSKKTARIDFTVLAPFWMQWWFVVLVAIALIGIIVIFYNYYRIKKMIDIERMRVRIASDLHDDVGSALTEIALQSDFLQTMDVSDSLEDSLQQIGEQSRKIVSSLDDIVWSIDARNDTLGDLTDRMQDHVNRMLPNLEIHYNFDGNMQEKLQVSHKENLYLIFKEAINNIAKHSDASRVDISLSTTGYGFSMSVEDNGSGFMPERKSGQGLRNMKMRAKRMDANIIFKNKNGFEVRVEKD